MSKLNITDKVAAKCEYYGVSPEEVAAARRAGNSISEVSRMFNIPRTSLSSLLKEMGLGDIPSTWGKQNALDIEQLHKELVKNDRSVDETAKIFGVGRNVIWRAATAAGIMEEKKLNQDKSICQRKNIDPDWLRKQVEAQRATKDIAQELGLSTTMVIRACKEEGIVRTRQYKKHRKKEIWDIDNNIEQYREQLESGTLTLSQLAEETHTSFTTLKRVCEDYDINVKNGVPTIFEKYNFSPEWLIEQRIENKRSCKDIAKEIGCPKGSIYRQCKKLGVAGFVKERTIIEEMGITKEWLIEEHLIKGRSYGDIAKELDIGRDHIERACNRYNIMTPVKYVCAEAEISEEQLFYLIDQQGMQCEALAEKLNVETFWIESIFLNYDINGVISAYDPRRFLLSLEWLYEQRINKHRSVVELAQETGLSYSIIKKICETNDLYVRDISTAEQYGFSNDWFISKRDIEHVSNRELARQLKDKMSRATIKKIYNEIDGLNISSNIIEFKENRNVLFRKELTKYQAILTNSERECQYACVSRAEKYGINYDWLYNKMIVEQKTSKDMCKILGVSAGTLGDICAEIGFEKHKMSLCEQRAIDPERLRTLRIEQRKNYEEIAAILGISKDISKYMCYEEGIEAIDLEKFYEEYDTDYEMLRKMRIEKRMPIEIMSKAIGCSQDKMKCVCYTLHFPRPNQIPYADRYGISYEQIKTLADEPKANLSYIAQSLELNTRTVERIMQEYGIAVPHNRTHSIKEDKWEKFLSDHDIPYALRQQCLRIGENNTGQEIDILVREHNIGLEISPTYTHNHDAAPHWNNEIKDVEYHQNKAIAAEKLGINLIHIFDWHDIELMKNLILSLCDRNISVDANLCNIREISDPVIENAFLENNSLQGYIPSTIAYGLYLNDELISCMTFSSEENNRWKVLRFANKCGINVVNGMLKLFEMFCERKSPSIVTAAVDYNFSNGTEYEALGFEYIQISDPSFYWVRNDGSKENYSERFIIQNGCSEITKIEESDNNKSIEEIMLSAGFVRVYDCGNKIYQWTND